MMKRYGILLLAALLAGASGCASTTRRDDGTPIFGPRAWSQPPAPPQRQVMLTASRSDQPTDPVTPKTGLAKYFPGLTRSVPPQTPRVATAEKSQPTWFGLRKPKPAATQTYMTDTREQLNRSGPVPTALPVALQVPTDRSISDRQVTPTSAEETITESSAQPSSSKDDRAPQVPDFGGRPARPGEDEVNPLPPATEPAVAEKVAEKMPPVPAVDPLDRPESGTSASNDAASDAQAVKASAPEAESTPPADAPKPKQPTTQVTETAKVAAPTPTPVPTPAATAQVVLASPQGEPMKPHVHATSQVKPTPQAVGTTAKTWKRPCLRRLVRRVWKLGEYANPPTAAPH